MSASARILVVDDQKVNRSLLELLLMQQNYETQGAATGEEALAMVARRAPDLMLVDVVMPGMDGYALVRALKALPGTSNIPVIMVSALMDRDTRMRALDAGAEEFLTTPVDRAELWLRVRNLLRLKEYNDFLKNHGEIMEREVRARTAELQRFRTAMDFAADAIFLVDRGSMLMVEANATACVMLGYSREELLQVKGMRLGESTTGQLTTIYDTVVAGIQDGRVSQTMVRRRDGSLLPVEMSSQARQIGKDWIIVCVMRDVTERGNSEREILRLNAELEDRVKLRTAQLQAANEELEAFSYSVSHDLRGPLNTIGGFSTLLDRDLAGGTVSERGRHALARVHVGVAQMGEVIDALLLLAQLSRTALLRRPVDLSAMALETLGACLERDPARSVECVVQPGMTCEADPGMLRQVLANLLGNAWKFSAGRDGARIEVSAALDDTGTQVFAVRDNGAGFDMAYAAKLFTAFERLHGTSEFAGTGIGLATVHRIIARHGGRIWGESAPQQGAVFYFTLGGGPVRG